MVDVEQLKNGGETTVFPKARENGTEPEEVGGQEGCDLDEEEAHHLYIVTLAKAGYHKKKKKKNRIFFMHGINQIFCHDESRGTYRCTYTCSCMCM
jgi:hypothetical protein